MTKPLSAKLTIVNRLGLHTRAAAQFVKLSATFKSDVKMIRGRQVADGKSIMGLLMLAAGKDTVITLEVLGPDQDVAFAALKEIIEKGFGEQG
jgi:phosphocarrier protein